MMACKLRIMSNIFHNLEISYFLEVLYKQMGYLKNMMDIKAL